MSFRNELPELEEAISRGRNRYSVQTTPNLFVFRSRCNTRLKVLAWDRDGFVLWYKRLEAGVFKLPKLTPGTRSIELRASELAMLLEGIGLSKLKRTPHYQHTSGVALQIKKK